MRNAFRSRIHGDQCVYCGERSDSDEHFPPASYGNLGFLLPACRECNSFAGTAHPLDFLERAAYVKERIKSHAPRFTFTSDTTLQDILAMPQSAWLAELRLEKRKAMYRSRFNWDVLAYIATIQTRRTKFIADMSDQVDEEVAYSGEAELAAPNFDDTLQESQFSIQDAHDEELFFTLLETLPKFSAKRRRELLLDDDIGFLASGDDFGGHLNSKEFEKLLVSVRHEEILIDPVEIKSMSRPELIELMKRCR